MNYCQHNRELVSCDLCRRDRQARIYFDQEMVALLHREMNAWLDRQHGYRQPITSSVIDPAFYVTLVTTEDEEA